MKRFTKAVAVTLTASMLLSFASCSKKEEKEKEEEEETTVTTTEEEETSQTRARPTSAPTPTPTPSPTAAPTPSPSPTPVPFDPVYFADDIDLYPTFSDEDFYGDASIIDCSISSISLDSDWEDYLKSGYVNYYVLVGPSLEAYPELAEALQAAAEEYVPEGNEYLELEDSSRFGVNAVKRRTDEQIFSFLYITFEDRVMTGIDGMNFIPQTGEKYTVDTVISDIAGLCDVLDISVDELYGEDCAFVIEPSGVTFVFLNDGSLEYKTVLYRGNESLFAIDNVFDISEYVMDLTDLDITECGYTLDIGNDGVPDALTCGCALDSSDCFHDAVIGVNGNEAPSDNALYGWEIGLKVVSHDGSLYLICHCSQDNDYVVTGVYRLTSGGAEFLYAVQGALAGPPKSSSNTHLAYYSPLVTVVGSCVFTDPSHIFLRQRCNLLGTYSILYPTSFGSLPEREGGYGVCCYHLALTARCDVSAADMSGAEVTIPEGTVLRLALADWDTGRAVIQDITDGTTYVITVDEPGTYHSTINGMDPYDLFDGIFYSG